MVRLDAHPPGTGSSGTATANIEMSIGDQPVRLAITVPAGLTRLRDLLPVLQGLTNVVVEAAVQDVERHGQNVSCRKGCGACCRQPVPVSESEARALKQLVDELPEPRRSQVRARFADVVQRLAAADLLEPLRHPGQLADAQVLPLGMAYFNLGLACPFLEDESCSIHADRPLACREYLVTTPAAACAHPAPGTIRDVPLPARIARAVRTLDRPTSASGAGWVTLALALDWSEAHPEEPPSRTGPAWLQECLALLTKQASPGGSASPRCGVGL